MRTAGQGSLSRRHFLRLVGAGATISVLTACGPAVQRPSEQAPAATGDSVTLSHWQHHAAGTSAAVEEFKQGFEAANPNVTIDFQPIPWSDFWGKLASAIAAGKGSAPDVFQIPMGLLEEYIAGDNLLPVSETAISVADIEKNYLPWTIQRGKQGDQYYGLPLNVQTLVMFRNNALYEEAGLDPTQPFVDHADLFDQAQKLTKKSGDQTDQIGCNTDYYSAWQTNLYQQYLQREENGQPWVDSSTNQLVWENYPALLDTFKWFCDLSAQTDDNSFLKGQSRFALGKVGMQIGHPVNRGDLKVEAPDLQYTVVPFPPRASTQELYTGGTHWMWVVGKWTDNADTAWNWVSFATNREAQETWVNVAGDLPSFADLVTDERFRQDNNAAVCMDSLSYATPWEWVGWAEWVKELGDGRDRVVIGGETAEASFATMVANLNQVIATHTVTS